MTINETTVGAVGVLAPQGALVTTDAKAFRDAALQAVARRRGRVVIDMSGVPFADSDGLEALLDVTDLLAAGGRALKVCRAGETLRESLELVGVASMFEFHDDVNDAARSFL